MKNYLVYDVTVDGTRCPQSIPGGTFYTTEALPSDATDHQILEGLKYRISPYKDYAKANLWLRKNAPYIRIIKHVNDLYVAPAAYAEKLHTIENRFLRVAREVGRQHPTSKTLDKAIATIMQELPFIVGVDGVVRFVSKVDFVRIVKTVLVPAWNRCDYESGDILPFPIEL